MQDDGFAQAQRVVLPERQGSNDLITASNRSYPSHTPSPSSYEFALHGLLALGSTTSTIQGAEVPQAAADDGDKAISMYDFATNTNIDPAPNMCFQDRPELHQAESGQSSALGFGTDHSTPDPSTRLPNFGIPTSLDRLHNADSGTLMSSEGTPAQAVSVDSSMELLKYYRYNIAPWLDICDNDQHFGVTLLTELIKSPALRSRVLQLASTISSSSWISKGLAMNEITLSGPSDKNVASDAAGEPVATALSLLAEMIPNLAASWLGGDGSESRRAVMERFLLESDSSCLTTCAYWLLVRLGKRCS